MYDEHKFSDKDYNQVVVHAPNCEYQNISPFVCEPCIKDQEYGVPDRVKLVPTDHIEAVDHEYLNKSCPTTSMKQNIPIQREEHVQALIQGDAALTRYFDPQDEEIELTRRTDDSALAGHTSGRSVPFNVTNPMELLCTSDYPILPLFPLVGLKRRKVMFYVPLTVASLSFDALIDTGACLSAIPLSLFNKVNEHSPGNILICTNKPSFHI